MIIPLYHISLILVELNKWIKRTSSLYSEFCFSPMCSPWSMHLMIFVATCQRPVSLHPVASKGKINRVFSCAGACWVHHSAPLLPDPTPRLRLPVEPWVAPPAAVSFPFPVYFFILCYGWLELHGHQANILMSQIWIYSEHTVQPGKFTLLPIQRTLIWSVWAVKTHEDKKGSVLY